MKGRIFIGETHKDAHRIIDDYQLPYDHRQDRVYGSHGGGAMHQLGGMVLDPKKVFILPGADRGMHYEDWMDMLKGQLARVRKSLDECVFIKEQT